MRDAKRCQLDSDEAIWVHLVQWLRMVSMLAHSGSPSDIPEKGVACDKSVFHSAVRLDNIPAGKVFEDHLVSGKDVQLWSSG